MTLSIAPGDRVAILADTRLEWTVASYGISAAGGVVVPVYPTSSAAECAWVLGDSGARLVVCENAGQVGKIEAVRGELGELEQVVAIEPGSGDMTLEQLRERGAGRDRTELAERQAAITADDAYTIIYTSGTTGPPKGVVLTHRNAMSVGEMVRAIELRHPGRADVPVPAAGPCVRPDHPAGVAASSARRSSASAATPSRSCPS